MLISDGHETETGTDYSRFLAQLERTKITLTTIGIGLTPNDKLLNTLAYAGKGRYYHAKTVNQIPSLALQEAKGMEEQLIVTMPLPVKKVEDDLAFAGIEADQMPPLYGYNRTRARTHAWTPLTIGRKSDPLLARMRYGRGQSLAFTSAAASSWMKDWIDKKPVEYATFWRQAVASVLPTPYRPMEPAVIYQDGEATFDFAACGVGPLVVQREKAGQDRAQSEKVEGSDVRTAGASAVLVTSGDATKHAFSWSRTYGREFADGAKAIEQLKAFTQASGGKYAPTVEEVLAPAAATHPVQSGPDVWLVLAALLLVAELLVRRIPALTRVLKGRRAD